MVTKQSCETAVNSRQLMSHRAGIFVSATVALLGSLLLLGMAGMMLLLPYIIPAKAGPFPPEVRLGMYFASALMLAGAAWGISTSIGLFRRDRWARISILIFACMMAASCLLSLLLILVIPLPAPSGGASPTNVKAALGDFYGLLAALGAGWALYFTRAGVKNEFGGAVQRTDPRPLSVVIIGWWLVIAACFVIPSMLLRMPAFLLGVVLSGWIAAGFYALFGALSFYIGRGLLQLDPLRHKLAIAYLVFGAVNGASIFLSPTRYSAVLQAMPAWMRPPAGAEAMQMVPVSVSVLISVVAVAVPLWFLIARRAAFARPPAA